MPKVIELTVQIDVQKVSCPGVWLCQSGRVSLIVFALGTSYQTCMLPPTFPLLFRDSFYFRKRFRETCALNNICCLLKDETIYCELVQWSDSCNTGKCVMLAQYLGSLNDVLFPPNMCSSDGVDLLMRRSKGFPGILSPKIEIATKVRIDELWNQKNKNVMINVSKCQCVPRPVPDGYRQKPVCHTPTYHRAKCNIQKFPHPTVRSLSRSPSIESRSCSSFEPKEKVVCGCPKITVSEQNITEAANADLPEEENLQKVLLESRYVDEPRYSCTSRTRRDYRTQLTQPCICDICKRYHELFHTHSDDR
ncbi:spermatogenesis-associated protein 6 [Battus philenor]|uniref:spermatogenesis-associated protein 6 n=1 Tax=Battus philenor TaxID=42288 RepID=UPI0035CFAA6D